MRNQCASIHTRFPTTAHTIQACAIAVTAALGHGLVTPEPNPGFGMSFPGHEFHQEVFMLVACSSL